jgi:hypothetical protein
MHANAGADHSGKKVNHLSEDVLILSRLHDGQRAAQNAKAAPRLCEESLHTGTAAAMAAGRAWRVSQQMHPQLRVLLGAIEGMWRQCFEGDLSLRHVDPRWSLLDSCDPRHQGELAYSIPDPQRGDPRYPRLVIENRVYETEAFRSLHLEVAIRQDGLQVCFLP